MSYSEIILLAIALSIDACIVSFSYGLCIEKRQRKSALSLAFTTGFFQALMPLIGYFFANSIKFLIYPYAKWIVFIIFMYLGLTFIKESANSNKVSRLCLDTKTLLLIGIATSIDAFSAGISLSLTSSPLKFSVIAIGLITFLNSVLGYTLGNRLKTFKSNYLEILGGLILIGLAIKNVL